jgi:hypothetical protein
LKTFKKQKIDFRRLEEVHCWFEWKSQLRWVLCSDKKMNCIANCVGRSSFRGLLALLVARPTEMQGRCAVANEIGSTFSFF